MEHRFRELSDGQKAKVLLLRDELRVVQMFLFWMNKPRNFSPLSGPVIRKMLREFRGLSLAFLTIEKYIEEVCDKIYQLNPNGLQLIGD